MIVNVCAMLIAAAIVVLVVYTLLVLKQAKRCLNQAEQSIGEARRHVTTAMQEAIPLLHAGHALTKDVQGKLADIDVFWEPVQSAGKSIRQAVRSIGRMSSAVAQTAEQTEDAVLRGKDRLAEAAEWIGTGVKLWQMWQTYRREKL